MSYQSDIIQAAADSKEGALIIKTFAKGDATTQVDNGLPGGIPSLAKFLDEKDTEINEGGASILAGAQLAQQGAETAAQQAADSAEQTTSDLDAVTNLSATAVSAANSAVTAAATIDVKTAQGAFVDFTAQSDGAPASALDSGQAVDFHFNATGREPVISSGRLVVNNQAGSGSGGLADYYQSQLSSPVIRVGIEFTMPSGSNDGNGNATYAAWNGIYEGGGTFVPKSWVHMSIIPGTGTTGTAQWYVCDGLGHLLSIKSQTFKNPSSDGVTPWRSEALLDANAGIAYAWLPDDTLMTLTNAEIAAFFTAVSVTPIPTFADLSASVIMCEHFCVTGASAAKFAQFKYLYGETSVSATPLYKSKSPTPRASARAAAALKALIPALPVDAVYAPTSALSVATTTSAANIDGTNGKVVTVAGPTGKVIVIASAYYEWSATDVLFWRLAGSISTPTRAADVGVSGQKRTVTQTIEASGLTPGQAVSLTLQHWTGVAGSATCKAGGAGVAMVPPLTLTAFPS